MNVWCKCKHVRDHVNELYEFAKRASVFMEKEENVDDVSTRRMIPCSQPTLRSSQRLSRQSAAVSRSCGPRDRCGQRIHCAATFLHSGVAQESELAARVVPRASYPTMAPKLTATYPWFACFFCGVDVDPNKPLRCAQLTSSLPLKMETSKWSACSSWSGSDCSLSGTLCCARSRMLCRQSVGFWNLAHWNYICVGSCLSLCLCQEALHATG